MTEPQGLSSPTSTSAPANYAYPDGALIHLDYIPAAAHIAGASARNTSALGEDVNRTPTPFTVHVIHTLATTFSCVLLVERVSPVPPYPPIEPVLRRPPGRRSNTSLSPSRSLLPKQLVLKLLDRRFAAHLRADFAAAPWTPGTESQLEDFNALPEDSRPVVSLPCMEGEDEEDSWTWTGSAEDQTRSHSRDGSSCGSSGAGQDDGEDEVDREDGEQNEQSNTRRSGQNQSKRIPNAEWSAGHREAYLEKWAQRLYRQELAVYHKLRRMQGIRVPMLYGTVRVRGVSSEESSSGLNSGATAPVQGMLLQYLHPAFPLSKLPARIPYFAGEQDTPDAVHRKKGRKSTDYSNRNTNAETWALIARAAVRLVQDIGDAGVLNADVRLDNILVVPSDDGREAVPSALDGEPWEVVSRPPHSLRKYPGPATVQSALDGEPWEVVFVDPSKLHRTQRSGPPLPSCTTYTVYMLDFGLARLQRRDEPDGAFLRTRRERDEEGAVGYSLQALLMKATRGLECDLPWRFVHSRRLDRMGGHDESDDETGF